MDKEKVQIWASLAHVISAIAVVITLIYVVFEFRYAEVIEDSEINMILYERQAEWNKILAENADLVDVLIKGRADPDSETPAERMRHAAFDTFFYDTWELAWTSYDSGVLDKETWLGWNEFFVLDSQKRSVPVWHDVNIGYDEDFEAIVNEALGSN